MSSTSPSVDPTEAEKGFGALIQHLRSKELLSDGIRLEPVFEEVCRYFIQKDLESTAWWRDYAERLTNPLRDEIARLTVECERLARGP